MKRLIVLFFDFNDTDNKNAITITEKRIDFITKEIKFFDSLSAILVILNIAISIFENEAFRQNNNKSTDSTNMQRIMCMLVSLMISAIIFIHYYLRLKMEKLQMKRSKDDNLITSRFIIPIIIEMSMCLIFCPPNLDVEYAGYVLNGKFVYSIDSLLYVLTLLKSYIFLRAWLHYSMWNNDLAKRKLKKFKLQTGYIFSLKAELKERPLKFLIVSYIMTIILCGLSIRTLEGAFRPIEANTEAFQCLTNESRQENTFCQETQQPSIFDYSYITNAVWLIIITMTTVGFGDGYPQTHLGRLIAVTVSLIGMVLVSLLVVGLTNKLEFTQEESKAYQIIRDIDVSTKTKEQAASVILNFLKFNQVVNQTEKKGLALRFLMELKLKKSIADFEREFKLS